MTVGRDRICKSIPYIFHLVIELRGSELLPDEVEVVDLEDVGKRVVFARFLEEVRLEVLEDPLHVDGEIALGKHLDHNLLVVNQRH